MTKRLVFIICITILFTTVVFANSMPIYMSEYPSFNIAPMEDCPIEVEKELLTFDMRDDESNAMVTAHYTMMNPTNENIKLPMIFPFVFDGYGDNIYSVKVNNESVDFVVRRVGDVNGLDYLEDAEAFIEAVQIEQIIEKINQPPYQMKNFKDEVEVSVYSFDFEGKPEGRYEVTYDIDIDKTAVIIDGFNGYGQNSDGQCTASNYISRDDEKGTLVVLGEDTLKNLKVIEGNEVNIEKTKVVLKDYIMNQLIEPEKENYAIYDIEGMSNAYGVVSQYIDNLYATGQCVLHSSDILDSLRYKQNLSVLLYEVFFEPNGSLDLEVQYAASATIDRRNSEDFTNTFIYLLNPAKGWAKFGELDIQINMNDRCPYVIDSSIPLEKIESGYTANLTGLPETDLIFTTYPKEEITFIDRIEGRLSRNYSMFLLSIVVGSVILGSILYLIIRKLNIKSKL